MANDSTSFASGVTVISGGARSLQPDADIRAVWQGYAGKFAEAAERGPGFSFRYDGKTVGPEFDGEWAQTVTGDRASGIMQAILRHKSGLTVRRETRVFPGFNAVEYRVYFKNNSPSALPAVSALNALDIAFGEAVLHQTSVICSGGGLADGFLPPRTFAIRRNSFSPTVPGYGPGYGPVHLTTEGGRSSNRDLPFFFVHNDAHQEGVFVAFGWSGQWSATAQLDHSTQKLTLVANIPEVDIELEPGEEIQGPAVLIGFYQGAPADGSNRLRRLIRTVYTPKLAGRAFAPCCTYDAWFGVFLNFDETLLRKLADSAAAIGQEYFLLDAGWYAGTKGHIDFSSGLGNWYDVNREKLPNGLGSMAEYVRSKNLKFGLWFEPERVSPGSRLAQEHPTWVLWEVEKGPELELTQFNKGYGLLDYGRPEVQQWVREMMDHYIRECGIKYVRYDFNIDPLPYWEAADRPGRRGVTQLKHIEGFYAVIDWIRERHPDVVLENCSSGGRRIDLETVRRFHTAWISDHTVDPAIIRFHLFGINYFLPGNYAYIQYTLPLPNQRNFRPDDLGFQSMFGGAFGTGGRVDLWSQEMRQKARRHVEVHKQLRRYLMEDYYPLSHQPADLQSWSGWQFQDPDDQSGFVQTFRTQTPEASRQFAIHQLDANARYCFTYVYSGESFEMSGAEAMTKGIEVIQEPMSSQVLAYRKLKG